MSAVQPTDDKWTRYTVGKALDEAVVVWGSKEAFVLGNARLTFESLREKARETSRAFIANGVRRGDRVAVWMAGYEQWPPVYYGLAIIGAVLVAVSTRLKPHELKYALNKSQPKFLIFKDEHTGRKDYYEYLREVIRPKSSDDNGTPRLEKIVAVTSRSLRDIESFDEFMESGRSVSDTTLKSAISQVRPDDDFFFLFTSGSTSLPKAVLHNHYAMLRASYYRSTAFGIDQNDRFLCVQPFFHMGGGITIMLMPIVTGATVVVQPYFDAGKALNLMEREKCTITLAHQPVWVEYLNHPNLAKRKLFLRTGIFYGFPELAKEVSKKMGIPIMMNVWGATEVLQGTSPSPNDPPDKRLYSVGRSLLGQEVEIRDPTTSQKSREGEICCRGWGVFKEYYEDKEATNAAFYPGGWFRTGDLGYVEDSEYVHITGRLKDVIRIGGENVAAAEIESMLLQVPQVKQVVVVGIPDKRRGEVPIAWVQLKDGESISEEGIIKYVSSKVARYKVPRAIIFTNEWPILGSTKIQRNVLRERAAHMLLERLDV